MNDINGLIKGMVKDLVSSELEALKKGTDEDLRDLKLYSESEAAAFLKRSKTTMWRLRKRGAISYNKYGKIIMYSHDDLMIFLDANKIDKL